MRLAARWLRAMNLTVAVLSLAAKLMSGCSVRWVDCQPETCQRVYFANHTSHLDALVLWAILPKPVRSLTRPVAARDYWEKNAFRRYIASSFNALLIDRENIKVHKSPVDLMLRAIGDTHSLIVFPEGGRNAGEEMGVREGTSHEAKELQIAGETDNLLGEERFVRPDRAAGRSCFKADRGDMTCQQFRTEGREHVERSCMLQELPMNCLRTRVCARWTASTVSRDRHDYVDQRNSACRAERPLRETNSQPVLSGHKRVAAVTAPEEFNHCIAEALGRTAPPECGIDTEIVSVDRPPPLAVQHDMLQRSRSRSHQTSA